MNKENNEKDDRVVTTRLKDVTNVAREAGLLIPVYLTEEIWTNWVASDTQEQDDEEHEKKRVRTIIDRLQYFIRVHRQTSTSNLIFFPVQFAKDNKPEEVQLLSYLGPLTQDDDRPCITIMTQKEYDSTTN